MDRRTFLRAATGAAAAAGLAGCSGGDGSGTLTAPNPGNRSGSTTRRRTDAVPNLELGLPTTEETTEGNLVVAVPVENVGDSSGAGTLVVTVRAGGETYEQSRAVSLPAGDERTVEVEFEVSYDEYAADGAVDFGWRAN